MAKWEIVLSKIDKRSSLFAKCGEWVQETKISAISSPASESLINELILELQEYIETRNFWLKIM